MSEVSEMLDELFGDIESKEALQYCEEARQEIEAILDEEPEGYGHTICGNKGKIKYYVRDVSGIVAEIIYTF